MNYRCSKCFQFKTREHFFTDKTQSRGFDYSCKDCKRPVYKAVQKMYRETNKVDLLRKQRIYAKKNPNIFLNNSLKFHYGITLDDYNFMLNVQNHVCAICGGTELNKRQKRLFVDHSHLTGKVRGLLCLNCNAVIGHLKEDVSRLDKIKNYLNVHNS